MFEDIPAGDVSGSMLKALFGENWESLTQITSGGAAGEAATLILSLLSAMSVVALAIGTLVLCYSISIGIIGTAHEGKPMGKLSTLWTPVRGAVGVALLIPSAKGLSMLMVVVLACVGHSVSFANYLANNGYSYLQDNGGQVTVSAPPSLRQNAEEIAGQALQIMAAQRYMNYKLQQEFSQIVRVSNPTPERPEYVLFFEPPADSSVKLAEMGAIIIPCTSHQDRVCQARAQGMFDMLSALQPAAHTLAASVMSEKELEDNGVPAPGTLDPDTILSAVDKYTSRITPVLGEIINQNNPRFQEGLDSFIEQAQKDGWLMLGSYYWTLSRFSGYSHDLSSGMPLMRPANQARLASFSSNDPAFDALWWSAEAKAREARQARYNAAQQGVDEDSVIVRATRFITDAIGLDGQGPVYYVARKLSENDPITALADWGHMLIGGMQTAWVAAIGLQALTAAGDAAASNPVVDLITLGGASAATSGLQVVVDRAVQLVGAVAVTLLGVGLFCAFYLPLLPFVLWIGSVISWLILVVETLFAAPLWAVAHMLPEGDGMAGQHGRQGYLLLFGVLARPPLMVAGLFSAMVIFAVVGNFIGESFLVYYNSVQAGRVTGVLTWIAQSVILCAIFVVFAHKIFGLVTYLPEKVIRWIGQLEQNLGEVQDEGRLRGIAVAATKPMSGGAGAAAKRAMSGGSEGGEPGAGADRKARGRAGEEDSKVSKTDRELSTAS
ncbi:DotA/TraY family protein [Desulfuromonas sp. AOP6]|uniref:DotA/TraY family protein n=1 Tax=Desulfuromonas sp. AOP6 TaxID=1566351 RepID=UPI00126C0743|nr:DotA/TraY family protein [Desulfuromonas sp. AOP6]BCA80305.1 hypothetical protein AOP6_2092 [Desulfuromonas sp. AOP6]